jgi:hypothetical protein
MVNIIVQYSKLHINVDCIGVILEGCAIHGISQKNLLKYTVLSVGCIAQYLFSVQWTAE